MTQVLRQSTQVVVRIGPFVDATDAVTPETGITLGAADQAEALKAAGAATVDISAATWTAITGSDGWYNLTLTTSHTDTVGTLEVVVQDSSVCLPVFARFQVVEEAVYDAMYASSAAGPLQSTVAGRTLDVSAGGEAGIDWSNVGTPGATVDLSATSINLCDTVTTNTDMRGTDSAATAAALATVDANVDAILVDTGTTIPGVLGTPAGASMSADIAAVKADTAAILVDTGTTLDGKIDTIDGIVDAILVDTGTTLPATLATIDGYLDTEIAAILADTGELQTDWANGGRLDLLLDAVKAVTDQMVFTKANELDVNTQSINGATVVGDGNATPWDGA